MRVRYHGRHYRGLLTASQGAIRLKDEESATPADWRNCVAEVSVLRHRVQEGFFFPTRELNYYFVDIWARGRIVTADEAKQWVPAMESLWEFKLGPLVDSRRYAMLLGFEDGQYPSQPIPRGIICLAFLPIATTFFVWSAAWYATTTARRFKQSRRDRAIRESRCPGCGYDIRHLPTPRCPECGSALAAMGEPA
jgi:hypothetical protein